MILKCNFLSLTKNHVKVIGDMGNYVFYKNSKKHRQGFLSNFKKLQFRNSRSRVSKCAFKSAASTSNGNVYRIFKDSSSTLQKLTNLGFLSILKFSKSAY